MAPVVKMRLSESHFWQGDNDRKMGGALGRIFRAVFRQLEHATRSDTWKRLSFWPVPTLQRTKQLPGWTLLSDYNRGIHGKKGFPIAAHLKNSSIFTWELSSWWPGAWSSWALGGKHSWGAVSCCVSSAVFSEWLEGAVPCSCNLTSGWQRSINIPRCLAGDQG